MSSQYPILDNRPIDQWKVTELKEELKRRKLTSRGLKDNLIKRLAEALRIERENAAKEVDGGFDLDPKPVDDVKNPELVSVVAETVKGPVDDVKVQFEVNDGAPTVVQGVVQEGSTTASMKSSSRVEEEKLLDYATGLETSNFTETDVTETFVTETVTETVETVVTEVALNGQDMQNFATHGDNVNINNQLENEDPKPQNEDPMPQLENEDSKPQLENEDSKPQRENEDSKPDLENENSKLQLENEDPKPQLENEDPRPQLENEDSKPQLENEALHEDPMLHSSAPKYQVSEVSTLLGSPVKSDSISTDSVSINEKIELKDNIIDDNVKLELDVVKPEMVRPSSSNPVAVGGESHPMDVEESHEKQASVEQKDDSNAVNEDMIRKNDSAYVEYSEKLNLDRSSGDDSMEDDALETKQIDSKYNDDELGDKSVKNELSVKEEIIIDVVGDDSSADKMDILAESRIRPSMPAEKRTLNDQEAGGNTEPVKRQRRWKSESLKVPEIQGSNPTRTTTPKDTIRSPGFRRNLSRSDSSVSEDAPKERVVPPSPKPPTNSLRIDRFLRPFTLKAVQELLGKTGQVTDFWMDHIKTHCFVTYSSVEEAVETRNAVYNLKWPSNGGCLLVAEFVDPQEVKIRVEAPQGPPHTPAVPVNTASTAPAAITPQPSPSSRQQFSRHQLLPPPPTLPPPPPPPPLSNPPPVRERLTLPQPSEKVDPPIVTLDDLFRKTKSTPRIYYLPLSEEQVAAKLAARSRATKP